MPAQVKRMPVDSIGALAEPAPEQRLVSAPAQVAPRLRLEAWFRDYFDSLWRLGLRLGVPHSQVDDVVQEAFITAERRSSEIEDGCARRFLVNTIVKLSANCRRRQATREQLLIPLQLQAEPPPDAEQLLASKQLREALEWALQQLPDDQRAVFVLFEIEGFRVPEIAELLEIPQGTVASRLGRARGKFSRAAARLRASTESAGRG